jgi:hypothetical protein
LVIVGRVAVFQHTPRAVTLDPPSDEISPPLVAVVEVIDVTDAVVSAGTTVPDLKLNSLP